MIQKQGKTYYLTLGSLTTPIPSNHYQTVKIIHAGKDFIEFKPFQTSNIFRLQMDEEVMQDLEEGTAINTESYFEGGVLIGCRYLGKAGLKPKEPITTVPDASTCVYRVPDWLHRVFKT